MGKNTKTVEDKFKTKISKLNFDSKITITDKQIKVGNNVLFKYSPKQISYTKTRYFPSLKEDIVTEDYMVDILLDHQTLQVLSDRIYNPPRGAKKVLEMVRHVKPNINKIIIGAKDNKIKSNTLHVTYDLYSDLTSINREEGKDKVTRVRNRVAPFLKDNFELNTEESETQRDYSLLLKEIVASKRFSQRDIITLTNELESGECNEIVIEKQINKQAQWLLDAMQTIIDEQDITKNKAQDFGYNLFKFTKTSISGAEKLMEKILTKYGQNIIFGVPALLNIDEYVVSSTGLPRSQFDIILINHLSDIEIVELKRPDEYLLEYEGSRGKFYMCKTLSIAVAQSERYISAIYRENDTEFKIKGKSIREYIESQFGNTITISVCRPKALIIMGTIQRLAKPYEKLSKKDKGKVSKKDYEINLNMAYKEIKSSFKNIDIITYSELIEGARLRLQLTDTSHAPD